MFCGFGGALLLFLITSAAAPLPSTDNQVAVIRCRHVSGPRAEIGLEYIPPGGLGLGAFCPESPCRRSCHVFGALAPRLGCGIGDHPSEARSRRVEDQTLLGRLPGASRVTDGWDRDCVQIPGSYDRRAGAWRRSRGRLLPFEQTDPPGRHGEHDYGVGHTRRNPGKVEAPTSVLSLARDRARGRASLQLPERRQPGGGEVVGRPPG